MQRHPSWRAIPVEVNPGFNGPIAIADRWGAAILPSLTPYRFSQVRLDAPTAPLGRNLGADRLTVLPTYRSGSLIVVGTAASITARGIILAPNGEPLSLQAGEVRALNQTGQAPIPFFTNRTGRFAIDELSPGRYEMRFFNLSHTPLWLEFSDQDEGLIDLGTLRLAP